MHPANSDENKYVQSLVLNGKPVTNNWISHSELQKGGSLNWMMGKQPNKKRGTNPSAFPYSFSNEYPGLIPKK